MGDRTLSIDDLCEVSDELETAALKWRRLGLALGLKSYRLDLIGADNSETLDCFTKTLGDWLKNTLPEPTWGDLAQALDSIGEGRLAQRVRVKYCGMEGPTPAELEAGVLPHDRLQGKQNQRVSTGCYKVFQVLVPVIIILSLSSYLINSAFSKSHLSHSCGVPYLTTDVIGRDTDAENVIKLIDFDNSKVRIVSIVGPPGIGKSTLAKYVGHNLVQNSKVMVHYIDMSGVTNVPAMTEKLLTCTTNEERETKDVLWKWADYHTLLLLDNADKVLQTQWNDFETMVQILIESSPYIKVLITSQKKQSYVHLSPVYEVVWLKVLSTEYACTLLHRMTSSSVTLKQAETIAELTGTMPLALTVIGARIKQKSYDPHTPENIIDKLRKEPFLTFTQTRHINASISVSYDYLDGQSKKFIHFIANFPESFDGVSITEIMNLYSNSPIARNEVSEMLQNLLELSLLEYDREQNRYNLHSVIRSYISGIREVAVIDRVRFSIAFQHYYLQVLANLSQTIVSDHITAITSYDVEQHNIEHFLYLFETLLHVNHTIYCRALDSIQLEGLIPCIVKQFLDTPINSEHRHINGSQTLDTSDIIVQFIQWNSNTIKGLLEVSVLLNNTSLRLCITSNVKLQFTRMLNIAIEQLKQLLLNVLDHIYESQSSNYVSIGDAYHILGDDSKSFQFYQLAVSHQQLHVIQQFYVNVRLYEIYVKTKFKEKAETVLHELSQLYPILALSYFKYNYEMSEIIRFFNHHEHEQSIADILTEKEIFIFDQLQATTACNIDLYMLNNWMELIHRKTYQRGFNKAAELGTTVIRVYKRQGECHSPLHSFPLHLVLSHIYYYTGIAMYGSNGSVDYLQRTLDITENETGHLFYNMRRRVCWILVSHGHQYCIKLTFPSRNSYMLHISIILLGYNMLLISCMIVRMKVDYTRRKFALLLFREKRLCFVFIVILIFALDTYYLMIPITMQGILLLLGVMATVAKTLTHSYEFIFIILMYLMQTLLINLFYPLSMDSGVLKLILLACIPHIIVLAIIRVIFILHVRY